MTRPRVDASSMAIAGIVGSIFVSFKYLFVIVLSEIGALLAFLARTENIWPRSFFKW